MRLRRVETAPTRYLHLPPPSLSHWVSLRYLNWMRILVPIVLFTSVLIFEPLPLLSEVNQHDFLWLIGGYFSLSVIFFLVIWQYRHYFYVQLFTHIACDILFIVLLMRVIDPVHSSMGVLMLLPVAGAAILSPLPLALLLASIATLALLGDRFFRLLQDEASSAALVQAGVTGFACFITALLIHSVARRLVRQEQLAEQRGHDLKNQLAINQLIISDMPNGVVVIDRDGRIRNYNPVAATLLGNPLLGGFTQGWLCLQEQFHRWYQSPERSNQIVDFAVPDVTQATSRLRRIRARFVVPRSHDVLVKDLLIFLEDLVVAEAQAQHLKLAAMGRLSANIAHEIRNPLSAIQHASALLSEDNDNPVQHKLTQIITANTQRINRIVEDILQLRPQSEGALVCLPLVEFLQKFVAEYLMEQGMSADRLQTKIPASQDTLQVLYIQFDEIQLRRVLVNLLSNALRYATSQAGSVCVFCFPRVTKERPAEVLFGVANDGPALSPDVHEQMFEPFFTTEARGIGLGLHIARELCLANQAVLEYQHVSELTEFSAEAFCIRAPLLV